MKRLWAILIAMTIVLSYGVQAMADSLWLKPR